MEGLVTYGVRASLDVKEQKQCWVSKCVELRQRCCDLLVGVRLPALPGKEWARRKLHSLSCSLDFGRHHAAQHAPGSSSSLRPDANMQ